jgi:serine/threonine-protein kinase
MKYDVVPIDPELLRKLEAELARHIGLRASVALRRALRTASSPDDLVRQLASAIADPQARSEFMLRAAHDAGVTPDLETWRWRHDVADHAIIERHLTLRLGPLAAVLVRQAAARTPALRTLIEELAEQIDDEADRKRFTQTVIAEIRVKNSRAPTK